VCIKRKEGMKHNAKLALIVVGVIVTAYLLSRYSSRYERMSNVAPPPGGGAEAAAAVHAAPGSVGGNIPLPAGDIQPNDLLPSGGLGAAWSATNPVSLGDLKGQNFLSAGALIGVNTIGQSKKNSSLDLRTELANPRVNVGPWMEPVKEGPDVYRRGLGDIGMSA
jgi:hypothetical protein